MANTFDDQSVQRIARTVRGYEKQALMGPSYRRRSRGRSKAGDVATDHPFKISATTELISILSGKVSVTLNDGSSKVDYSFPSGDIDISGITTTSTIYVYLKCAIQRFNSNDILDKPVLTVAETNFYQNTQKFPESDLGNYYLPLGFVYLTVDGDNISATASQLQFTNEEIKGPEVHPFLCTSFYDTKSSDLDTDSSVTVHINKGIVTTQEGNQSVSSISSNLTSGKGYIKISFTLNSDGYAENYTSSLLSGTFIPLNTPTDYHFEVSNWFANSAINSIKENFISDGRIF